MPESTDIPALNADPIREYFGGAVDFGRDAINDTWWPWVVAAFAVVVVALGAVLFTP